MAEYLGNYRLGFQVAIMEFQYLGKQVVLQGHAAY